MALLIAARRGTDAHSAFNCRRLARGVRAANDPGAAWTIKESRAVKSRHAGLLAMKKRIGTSLVYDACLAGTRTPGEGKSR